MNTMKPRWYPCWYFNRFYLLFITSINAIWFLPFFSIKPSKYSFLSIITVEILLHHMFLCQIKKY